MYLLLRTCLVAFYFASFLWSGNYTISKVAGAVDSDNIPATSIGIGTISSIARGPNGSLYYAGDNLLLYQVSSNGIRTRIPFPDLGNPRSYIFDLSVAPNGDLYVAVMSSSVKLFKLTGGRGAPELIAGEGSSHADGPALQAYLGVQYFDMAAANDGLYFTDGYSIRKITGDKVTTVQTLPTSGSQTKIEIAIDGSANLYLYLNNRILKRTPAGELIAVAGGGTDFRGENIPATSIYLPPPHPQLGCRHLRKLVLC